MPLNEYLWSLFHRVVNIQDNEFFNSNCHPFVRKFEEFCKLLNEAKQSIFEMKNTIEIEGDTESEYNSGLYICAFCSGVEAVFDDFYDIAVQLEDDFLNNSDLSIMHIETKVNPLRPILNALNSCIKEVKTINCKGCLIFDCLEKYTNSGDESIENYFKVIQEYCLKPFFMQMFGWIGKSEIYDPYREFFIQRVEVNSDNVENSFDDEVSLVRSSDYKIDYMLLPECIPDTLSEKVLFMGECLIFCRDKGKNKEDINMLKECFHSETVGTFFQNFDKKQTLIFIRLENCIEEIWTSLNQNLHKMLVTHGSLSDQLKQISDIFFIGRGELFQEFLTKIKNYYNKNVTKWTNMDLEKSWEKAIYEVYHIDYPCKLLNVKIKVDLNTSASVKDVLYIVMETNWVHQLLIGDALDIFNRTFRFLLRLKKSQMDLNSVWIDIKNLNGHRIQFLAIEVRNKLLGLIGSLQTYCFLQVIQPNLNVLLKSMENTVTFSDLQNSLIHFQNKLIEKLFIMNEKIMSCMHDIFNYCETFPKIFYRSELIYSRLNIFKTKLETIFKYLFDYLEQSNMDLKNEDMCDLLLYLKRVDYC